MSEISIRPFEHKAGSEQEYAAYAALRNAIRKEALPEDPPTATDQVRLQLQNVPPVFDLVIWVGWSGTRAVAQGNVGFARMDTNQHIAQFDIEVLPAYRKQGIATDLLKLITERTREEGRTLLIGSTRSTIPAGEDFMKALGARVGLSMHVNELRIADLDRAMLTEWQTRARERAHGFTIGLWTGRYPEGELEAIASMKELMNTMPREDLDLEDFHWTTDQLRQMDDANEATGDIRWCMYAVEDGSGRLVGYSEMYWHPGKPTIAGQGDTAVLEEFKNRGLGRWLKAAMLEKLVTDRPEVKLVRTGNAQSNAPMLKINNELGFRPAMSVIHWQAPVEKVEDFVRDKMAAAV